MSESNETGGRVVKLTASVQILPLKCEREISEIVGDVVKIIKESGLNYEIGAHATVVEGEFGEIIDLVKKIYEFCHDNVERSVLNVQFDIKKEGVSIEGKVEKIKREV
ncbi:MAG: thiamine-binding protein [Thermotogae bacterium]|nr:thiamine-binding protein [Thermotogota bacterium]